MPRRSKNDAANAAEKAIEGHVAVRVRLRRGLLGMSQSDLAKALGITFQQVQKYERGSNRISVGKLYRLADILEVPLTFFFDGLDLVRPGAGAEAPGQGLSQAEVLSRREMDLLRAWREAPEDVSDAVSSLMRSFLPPSYVAPDAPPEPVAVTVREEPAAAETPAAPARRRGRPRKDAAPAEAPAAPAKRRRQAGALWDPSDIKDYGH